jgi:hypothetical protein
MEGKSTTSMVLLTALISLLILISWSFVGTALGGSGKGGADRPENEIPPDDEAEDDDDWDEENDGSEAECEAEAESESESEAEPQAVNEVWLDIGSDFLPDDDEISCGTDQYDWDNDNDHLSDGIENTATDPNIFDTDNDGI